MVDVGDLSGSNGGAIDSSGVEASGLDWRLWWGKGGGETRTRVQGGRL